MSKPYGFFEATAQGFEPLPFAVSAWSPDMVNGPALAGLLARALERDHCPAGFIPARLTVDLFRPTRMQAMSVSTTLIRKGGRILVADAELTQEGVTVARASAIFLRPSVQPPGEIWIRDTQPEPPSPEVAPIDHPFTPIWGSDSTEWSADITAHQNGNRKRGWQHPIPVVLNEPVSPFAGAAMIGESTSMMTNWGSAGIGFINTDLTLALARLPIGNAVGVEAENHISTNGIAVGSATLFDRNGSFGTAITTALSNADRQVDFTQQSDRFTK